jgi:hypothetical protein
MRIGIGSDWSPSGSKNLLFELRVARLVAQASGAISDRDLIAMATIEAAGILGWQKVLGSLEAGKRADILVVGGRAHDAYEHLFHCRESDVDLVVIDGIARSGSVRLMTAVGRGTPTEEVSVGDTTRLIDLAQDGVDPAIAALSLAAATTRVADALNTLPALAKAAQGIAFIPPEISLELDHDEMPGFSLRPELPDTEGRLTGLLPPEPLGLIATPLADLLEPIELDPLTVVDDHDILETLSNEKNLPPELAAAIGQLG